MTKNHYQQVITYSKEENNMSSIPKPLEYNEFSVGDKVYCPAQDCCKVVTEKIVCSEGYQYALLDGVLYGHYNSLYRSKEDYLEVKKCLDMANTIWNSFDWGVIPPNINKDHLEKIVGWLNGCD